MFSLLLEVVEVVAHIMAHLVVEVQADLEQHLLNLFLHHLDHTPSVVVVVVMVVYLDLMIRTLEAIVVQTPQHLVYKLMVEVAAQTDNRLGEIHLDLLEDQVVAAAATHQMLLVLVEHMVMMVEMELRQVLDLVVVVVVPVGRKY